MQNTAEVKKFLYMNLEIAIFYCGTFRRPTSMSNGTVSWSVSYRKMAIATLGWIANMDIMSTTDCKRLYDYAVHFQFLQAAAETASH